MDNIIYADFTGKPAGALETQTLSPSSLYLTLTQEKNYRLLSDSQKTIHQSLGRIDFGLRLGSGIKKRHSKKIKFYTNFDHNVQASVNRIQSTEEIKQHIIDAHIHGFQSINVDLMYGLTPHVDRLRLIK